MRMADGINQDAYNLIAANYASEHGAALAWKPELDMFLSQLDRPRLVLDLGCGPGDETAYLARCLPGGRVIGVDFSEKMIALARAQADGSGPTFVAGDITTYVPPGSVQGIWARAALHHLNDGELAALFDAVNGYGGPGLLVGMVNKLGSHEEIEEKQKYGARLRRYFNYFSPDKVHALAAWHGYAVVREYEKPEAEHTFLVTFLRKQG